MKQNLWDNTDQIKKIRYRLNAYLPIAFKAIKNGVSIKGLIYSRFPYYFGVLKRPACITLELTDACDLKCVYCNYPLFSNPRIFMSESVFSSLINRLDELKKIDRLIVSGGEPTLHPQFTMMSEELSKRTRFLSIVTNAQWKKESIAKSLLNNYNLIEISVDAGGEKMYEDSRKGASFQLLIRNLEMLNRLKRETKSKSHINLRFMIRPSNDKEKENEFSFWKNFCDTIMPQYVMKDFEMDYVDNVYQSKHIYTNSFPKCTLPFKNLQIRANGNIPLCQVTGSAISIEKKRIIGNVFNDSLFELWNGKELSAIRSSHKNRNSEGMEVCKDCRGV